MKRLTTITLRDGEYATGTTFRNTDWEAEGPDVFGTIKVDVSNREELVLEFHRDTPVGRFLLEELMKKHPEEAETINQWLNIDTC